MTPLHLRRTMAEAAAAGKPPHSDGWGQDRLIDRIGQRSYVKVLAALPVPFGAVFYGRRPTNRNFASSCL
ncbi:MAG: hypothetical protein PHT60_06585 [Acidiphilium sp.]|nr:hypothetical protein [Acidiphilium sp.]MDD4935431.1 hypothetical protein [Acidiphilium sp.]